MDKPHEYQAIEWVKISRSDKIFHSLIEVQDSLKSKNRPVRMINMPSRNSESIASLMVIFLVEVLVLAELKKINPYGQAAVEDIKVKTFSRLNK